VVAFWRSDRNLPRKRQKKIQIGVTQSLVYQRPPVSFCEGIFEVFEWRLWRIFEQGSLIHYESLKSWQLEACFMKFLEHHNDAQISRPGNYHTQYPQFVFVQTKAPSPRFVNALNSFHNRPITLKTFPFSNSVVTGAVLQAEPFSLAF
jgi:hypothetical protein